MRFLRHKRGGGRVDETSEVCAFSVLDRLSRVIQNSSVWSSSLTGETVVADSTVTNAIIENSDVSGARIHGGRIRNSLVAHAELIADYADIANSVIGHKCRIAHTAQIENVNLTRATIGGDAVLSDWHKPGENRIFDGRDCYIMRGVWRHPPRILVIGEENRTVTVTESLPGFAFVGCREMRIDKTLRGGIRLGALFNLSRNDVALIRDFLESLR